MTVQYIAKDGQIFDDKNKCLSVRCFNIEVSTDDKTNV